MTIKLVFFASVREALGTASETMDIPLTVTTVATLRDHLAGRGEEWSALTTTKNLRFAVNQQLVDEHALVRAGDEVAFFPPVTGG